MVSQHAEAYLTVVLALVRAGHYSIRYLSQAETYLQYKYTADISSVLTQTIYAPITARPSLPRDDLQGTLYVGIFENSLFGLILISDSDSATVPVIPVLMDRAALDFLE